MTLTYTVVMRPHDGGFLVGCPELYGGCWAEGATEDEALANITAAIRAHWAPLMTYDPCWYYPAEEGWVERQVDLPE